MKTVWMVASLSLAGAAWPADSGAAGESEALHARLVRATSRCAAQADLIACGEALSLKPNDAQLLVAEGDALVRQNRPGEAIGVYRNASRQSGNAVSVEQKIDQAEAQRRALSAECENQEGEAARRACDAAWLPGASDEAALFRRRGDLLRKAGRLSEALDAFMAAGRLRPAERSTALAIIDLNGRVGREDAATLLAEGQALLALGRPAAALAPLRRAVKLAPALAQAKARLRVAERLAQGAAAAPVRAEEPAAATIPPPRFTNEEPLTRSN